MAKNVHETVEDTMRGETAGQLTPEAQNLWDRYNQVYGNVQNMPMAKMKMRSGAVMDIMDPSAYLKQRALQKVLGGMTQTGLGTRAQPRPGMLGQMAPFITALGSDPKFQKWLAQYFGGGKGQFPVGDDYQVTDYAPSGSYDLSGGSPADFYAADASDAVDFTDFADTMDYPDYW